LQLVRVDVEQLTLQLVQLGVRDLVERLVIHSSPQRATASSMKMVLADPPPAAKSSLSCYNSAPLRRKNRMPGIGLITNPRSRLNQRDPSRMRKWSYLLGTHGTAEATKSLDDLYRVAEEFKKERIDILGISGGDGTLHHTLTAVIQTYGDQPLPLVAI